AYEEALEEDPAVEANEVLLVEEASVQVHGLEEVRSHLEAAVLAAGGMVAEPGLVPVGGDLDRDVRRPGEGALQHLRELRLDGCRPRRVEGGPLIDEDVEMLD